MTRESLLIDIMRWISNPEGNRIFWLHGFAGSGKSTVANTIASRYMGTGLLGASFRFNRDIDGRNRPMFLFRNIAYQLALFDGHFRESLLQAIARYGSMNSFALREQLERFIVEPMHEVSFVAPVLIVIDAIDECGIENERKEILQAIAKALPKLPGFVKVLLTSRGERDIRAAFAAVSTSVSINAVKGIADDIRAYTNDRMDDIVNLHAHLETGWPGRVYTERFSARAGGLFIWVTVASTYIKDSVDPDQALNAVLGGQTSGAQPGPEAALDDLYLGIMRRTQALHHSTDATKYVVGSILVAKIPLTLKGLDSLLGLGRNVQRTLRDGSRIQLTSSAPLIAALASILQIDNQGFIRILHASVIDFFTNPNRCTDERFFIDRCKYNREIAIRCFQTMDGLKRDVCAINDPTKFNSEILDLDERLNKYLTEHLRYACGFWNRHLEDVADDDVGAFDQAKEFLLTHLLHWIEVMSLLNDINGVLMTLRALKPWFHVRPIYLLMSLKFLTAMHRTIATAKWMSIS
jgi:hypothetical protein